MTEPGSEWMPARWSRCLPTLWMECTIRVGFAPRALDQLPRWELIGDFGDHGRQGCCTYSKHEKKHVSQSANQHSNVSIHHGVPTQQSRKFEPPAWHGVCAIYAFEVDAHDGFRRNIELTDCLICLKQFKNSNLLTYRTITDLESRALK